MDTIMETAVVKYASDRSGKKQVGDLCYDYAYDKLENVQFSLTYVKIIDNRVVEIISEPEKEKKVFVRFGDIKALDQLMGIDTEEITYNCKCNNCDYHQWGHGDTIMLLEDFQDLIRRLLADKTKSFDVSNNYMKIFSSKYYRNYNNSYEVLKETNRSHGTILDLKLVDMASFQELQKRFETHQIEDKIKELKDLLVEYKVNEGIIGRLDNLSLELKK